MKTILVATDFSPSALNAANYAAEMALAINATILLLHVYQLPLVNPELPLAVTEEDMRLDAESEISNLKKELTRKTGGKLPIETDTRMGVFFSELNKLCDHIKPYTVVMGSQGSTATERFLLGGHTVYAMKHLKWPIISVPPGARFSTVKKIGLACDFDKVVDKIPLDEIKTLVNDFKAELYILNTGNQEVFDPEIIFESSLLEKMLAPLKPHFNFIVNSDRDEGILDFTEENLIDLLVVLPKRHVLLDRLIHRSMTKQLVLHSHVPVMALHQLLF
ncbi:MAG: universal stress protein [Ferruginibacter sp.]